MLKTFYINLDTSQQRNARMVDQLQALGLPFERIAAVNGATLSQQQKSLVDEEKFLFMIEDIRTFIKKYGGKCIITDVMLLQ